MNVIKAVVIFPSLISTLWLANPASQQASYRHGDRLSNSGLVAAGNGSPAAVFAARKVQVHILLVELDRLAEISMEMSPERSAMLDPVIVELAEQALDLISDEGSRKATFNDEFDQLESAVQKLGRIVDSLVEPEFSL